MVVGKKNCARGEVVYIVTIYAGPRSLCGSQYSIRWSDFIGTLEYVNLNKWHYAHTVVYPSCGQVSCLISSITRTFMTHTLYNKKLRALLWHLIADAFCGNVRCRICEKSNFFWAKKCIKLSLKKSEFYKMSVNNSSNKTKPPSFYWGIFGYIEMRTYT